MKLPPESYARNLLWAARASELKQFDDIVTFTFQKDTFYIHTLHIFSIHLELAERKLIGKSLSGWLEPKNDL